MSETWYDELPEGVALETGMRRANVFGLRWEDVDFEAGVITAKRTKSGVSYHVAMHDPLRAVLRALPSRLRSPWVFPSETGETPLDGKNFVRRVFEPALVKAEITDFRFHDLRHTFASRLAMMGENMRTVQELLGHQSLRMTERYAHLSPAHKLAAVQRLGERLSEDATGTATGTEVESTPLAGAPSSCAASASSAWRPSITTSSSRAGPSRRSSCASGSSP